MTQVRIPVSLDAAVEQLGVIGKIVTAQNWERAAVLAAYVQPDAGHGGRAETASSSRLVSATEFSRKGIHGLRSKDTVLRYVNAWLSQRPRPQPGEAVDLDGLPDWPPDTEAPGRNVGGDRRRDAIIAQAEADGTGASKALDIASNPKAMMAAIKADPNTEIVAKQALNEAALARHERLRPPPGSADSKAIQADLMAKNDATRKITIPVLDAAVALQQVQRDWEEVLHDLVPRERDEVARALTEISVIAGALQMYIELEAQHE